MKFYSGFSLKNEEHFFKDFIKEPEYTVCGFSYGAIKAFKFVKQQLALGKRVDTLQLFSPAFFQTKSDKFKRLQHISFTKSKDKYLLAFLNGCFFPHPKQDVQRQEVNVEQLDELLNFQWLTLELQEMVTKGVKIEVYLGSDDKIIDVEAAKNLFLDVATVTYVKNANHFLQTK